MSENRSPRRRAAVGAAVLAGLVGLTAGCTASADPTPGTAVAPTVNVGELASGVTITGQGEVSGTPDTLTITFGVSVLRPSVDAAVAANAEVATKVQGALRAHGLGDADIQTRNYSIAPNFRYDQGQQKPDGYRVDNTVSAKVKDLAGAGGLIDAVAAAGGDDVRVQGVSFSIEDDTALLAQARDRAYADAKAKADQYATLTGRRLGAVEAVSEVRNQASPTASPAYAQDAAGGAAPTPINPGQLQTTLVVTVRYALA